MLRIRSELLSPAGFDVWLDELEISRDGYGKKHVLAASMSIIVSTDRQMVFLGGGGRGREDGWGVWRANC